MKVLVIGSGGREHAIAWKLSKSPKVQQVYVAPGNGGTARNPHLKNVPLSDVKALADFADRHRLDFSALLVTDVVSNGSLLLLSQESEAWEEINYPRLDRGLYALKNVVSRKKQLVPYLVGLLKEL